ncbi:hypothetical protein GCM10027287_41790 [Bordetella muralis]
MPVASYKYEPFLYQYRLLVWEFEYMVLQITAQSFWLSHKFQELAFPFVWYQLV